MSKAFAHKTFSALTQYTSALSLQVSVLLIVLLFVFASYGVQMYGGRLARCNDETITERKDCVGVFIRQIFVTKMKLEPTDGEKYPAMLVPRVW